MSSTEQRQIDVVINGTPEPHVIDLAQVDKSELPKARTITLMEFCRLPEWVALTIRLGLPAKMRACMIRLAVGEAIQIHIDVLGSLPRQTPHDATRRTESSPADHAPAPHPHNEDTTDTGQG